MYDLHLDRFDVALAAVWTLYRRGKWPLLRELGMDRHRAEPQLDALTGDLPRRLTTLDHHLALVRRCPAASDAALELQRRYQDRYAASRQAFYGFEEGRAAR